MSSNSIPTVSIRSRLLAGALAVVTLVALPTAASATPSFDARGAVGPVAVKPGVCVTAFKFRSLYNVPPAIYARNLHAGAGNDRMAVRYRSYLVSNGRYIGRTDFSGWAIASDNQPAAFTGVQRFDSNVPAHATLVVYVEWNNGRQRVGWGAYNAPSYLWNQGNNTPQGVFNACPYDPQADGQA
jgi:hypothetical protein